MCWYAELLGDQRKHHFVRMKVEVFRTQEVVKRAFKLQAGRFPQNASSTAVPLMHLSEAQLCSVMVFWKVTPMQRFYPFFSKKRLLKAKQNRPLKWGIIKHLRHKKEFRIWKTDTSSRTTFLGRPAASGRFWWQFDGAWSWTLKIGDLKWDIISNMVILEPQQWLAIAVRLFPSSSGPWTSSISIIWEPMRHVPSPRLTKSHTLEVNTEINLANLPMEFGCKLQFKNHSLEKSP